MSKCPNCNAQLSCGCQKRVTPNGKVGCTKCINSLLNGEKKDKKTNIIDVMFNNIAKN